jgi:hypothetical protein
VRLVGIVIALHQDKCAKNEKQVTRHFLCERREVVSGIQQHFPPLLHNEFPLDWCHKKLKVIAEAQWPVEIAL